VGAAAGISADQHPAPQVAGQLRQREPGGLDVVAGGVGARVPRPQHDSQRLPGAFRAVISEDGQRVMAIGFLPRGHGLLFLRARGHDRRVDVHRDKATDLLNGAKIYVLAAIEHGTRRVRVLGATEHPVQAWVVQQARNLLMDLEDAGTRVKFVLYDRDASLYAGVRCRVPGCGRQCHPLCGPGAANEFDHGTVDRQLPPGAAGPHPRSGISGI
jgi:hypothetical protein